VTDPTRNERQRRFQSARRRGLVLVHGYLPPKQAAKVKAWIAEAEKEPQEPGVADRGEG